VHYGVLLVGFYIAIAALGADMTKFAILAGAFGVGIGFGLQNVFNNFFSGLILLFERPVQVGDVIEVGVRQESLGASAFAPASSLSTTSPSSSFRTVSSFPKK
jgi:Small-conductance mechanosensitive channel